MRLWDARTGTLLERFEGHGDSVYSVTFTNNGQRVVSGALDKTVKIWQVSPRSLAHMNGNTVDTVLVTTSCLQTYTGHKDYVLCVASGLPFADESVEWVMSSSKDRTVICWNAEKKEPVAQFQVQGHKNSGTFPSFERLIFGVVIAVCMSPAGGKFATASGDARARIWSFSKTTKGEVKPSVQPIPSTRVHAHSQPIPAHALHPAPHPAPASAVPAHIVQANPAPPVEANESHEQAHSHKAESK